MKEIFPEFEENNNCIIKFDTMNDDTLLKKAKFQHESGKVSTDVIFAHDGVMYEWIRNEYIIPLDIDQWEGRSFSRVFRYRISSGVPGGDYTSWGEVKQIYDDAFHELVLKRGAVDLAYLDAAQEKLDNLRR